MRRSCSTRRFGNGSGQGFEGQGAPGQRPGNRGGGAGGPGAGASHPQQPGNDAGFAPGSEFLWDYHYRVYWDLTQRIYREAMDEARLEPYHFVGHGLGITLHEDPFVNELRSIELEPGMVLCIEPLTLLDGRFGVQIEDEVLITADGYEPFSQAPELLALEG